MRIQVSALCGHLLRSPHTLWTRLSALSPTDNTRTLNLIRASVLASAVLLMLPGAWGHSVTVVEFAHLPAGLAAWQRHSLGIYRVCGPLSKFLYALPAHLAGVRVDYPESFDSDVGSRREWEVGHVFQKENKDRYHDIYRWSRLLPILVTVLGGCLICEWSTRLFGAWPGVVSLCVWCWMPPILAHGSLVTSDMLSAVLLIWAARLFWLFLLEPRLTNALLTGLALGLAQATKFTLLVLGPCWGLLLVARTIQLRYSRKVGVSATRGSPGRLVALGLISLVISLVVLDSLYDFRDMGFRLSQWEFGQSSLIHKVDRLGDWRATSWLLQVPLPIPKEFLRGLDFQLSDSENLQPTYLLGQTRVGGWWYWYAAAFLFKVPLPALALFVLMMVRLPRDLGSREPIIWAALCILIPAAEVALTITSTTGTGSNAAFRYLIPALALLCVWVGCVSSAKSKVVPLGTTCCLVWLAFNAVGGVPDHLGWQNELGSFCSRRVPALIGDSLDWGQDLARLSDWISLHSHEGNTLVCVYGFGEGDPYGLREPSALPISESWERATYLAISEDILFGYEAWTTVTVGGRRHHFMDPDQRALLLSKRLFDRVGRTIRIYSLLDLAPRIADQDDH
jgi:hypothetical protein